ncbi:MAG: SH3 domain-containing protein [Proteobacteria bacterium]|nr:SH3 domain-containing protein [Pseudomonadota bacterium]
MTASLSPKSASKLARQLAQSHKFKARRKMPETATKAPTVSTQADPIGTATVTCSSLNVRKGPGTNYDRIGGLSNGKSVSVFEDTGEWLKIGYGTDYGYICQKYTDFKDQEPVVVDPPKPEPDPPKTGDNTPPAGATYTGTETVKKGSSNKEAVKTLQLYLNKYLKEQGVSEMSVDSDFGNTTWMYLMYYQYTRNLCDSSGRIEVDGICGPKTWEAIRSGAPAVYNLNDPIPFSKGKKLDVNCTQKLSCGGAMQPKAAAAFEKLIVGAKGAGYKISTTSTFRAMSKHGTSAAIGGSHKGQIELFVDWGGNTTYAAKPGYSNHQSGKAADISMSDSLFNWLSKNAAKYDFKNYPAEKWHWDYVGS